MVIKNINIYSESVKYIFNCLNNINFFYPKTSYTIMANEFNFLLIIKGIHVVDLMTHIDTIDYLLSFYQINNDIIVDGKFIDWYGIKKNFNTFTQRDDNIRINIIQLLLTECNSTNKILFIGGEMYTFAKVLKYSEAIAFTDCEGIKMDTIFNNNNIQAYAINYESDNIIQYINKFKINPDMCIVNVLNGLTVNLIKQIASLNINKVIIISCKPTTKLNIKNLENLGKFKNLKIYKFTTPNQEIQLSIWHRMM